MAPSPTGDYHIGHIRTILYNWAFAKKNKGEFLLRIEDTDRTRYVEGAVDRILDVIRDFGFSWDEGPGVGGAYGPYMQSRRLDLYKKYAQELIAKGCAYYCFCSQERLKSLRQAQQAQGLPTTKYDRHCLHLSPETIQANLDNGMPYVIRLQVPEDKTITFDDKVYGHISVNSNDLDDQILLKSDGFPTYHLAVVVDDHLMKITHIMRGNDWLPSTPKRILLYEAFGWTPPIYIHLPNIKEKGGSRKLGKRFGSVFASEFLREGYLSEALLNFLMFLGWNPGGDQEIYTLAEFVNLFSVDRIHKTDLVSFDRDKLLWFNGYYIRTLSVELLWNKLMAWAVKFDVVLSAKSFDRTYNLRVLSLVRDRLKKLDEFEELTTYFYKEPMVDKSLLMKYAKDSARTKGILIMFKSFFESVDPWSTSNLDAGAHALIQKQNYKPKEAFMTLRVAVTGSKATPPIFDLLEVLGKDVVLRRLASALQKI